MRTNHCRFLPEAAFTLIELMVVIAMFAILAALAIPAFSKAQDQTLVAQCAGNLRQLDLAQLIYGADFHNNLPVSAGGVWAWDLPSPVAALLSPYGAARANYYCPANPGQNVNGLWSFGPSLHVAGYAFTFKGTASVAATNLNSTIVPQPIASTLGTLPPPPARSRPLVADATLTSSGQDIPTPAAEATYSWQNIQGGYTAPGWTGHRTAHMLGSLPAGGNVAMLDGHVEWHPLSALLPRTTLGEAPSFWW
jgi:prepilin-type N-terminal cleavage/methylation domain-containing protein/prepilin-type processing-associated H-X9-DG protein